MDTEHFKLQSEEYEKIVFILSALEEKCQAGLVSLIARSGQEIAHAGHGQAYDRQALASLAASNLAATFGLSRLIGEEEFERILHKGVTKSILIHRAGGLALLLLILEGDGQGPIDLKALRQASLILEDILAKSSRGREPLPVASLPSAEVTAE